jgi:ABC-type uncharacterized transport system ATPase subunit
MSAFHIESSLVHALVGENCAGTSTSGILTGIFAGPRSKDSTGNVVNVDGGVTAAYPGDAEEAHAPDRPSLQSKGRKPRCTSASG